MKKLLSISNNDLNEMLVKSPKNKKTKTKTKTANENIIYPYDYKITKGDKSFDFPKKKTVCFTNENVKIVSYKDAQYLEKK